MLSIAMDSCLPEPFEEEFLSLWQAAAKRQMAPRVSSFFIIGRPGLMLVRQISREKGISQPGYYVK